MPLRAAMRGPGQTYVLKAQVLIISDQALFAEQQYTFLFEVARRFNESLHQLTGDALPSKFRQHNQRKDNHISAVGVMTDQLLQLLIADVILVRGSAVEHSDHSSTQFSDEETLWEYIHAELNCLTTCRFLGPEPGSLDDNTLLQVHG